MARYYQKPQSPIVDLTPQYPTEFYSRLIDQVQQNRNQASAASAAFMSDAYGQEFINQAARDKAMELAKDPLAKALDKDIVTPASMAQAVGQASKAVAPWKNLNKKQMELVKQAEAYKLQHGANALVKDPSKMSLMDDNGSWVDPNNLKLTALNAKQFDEIFDNAEKGRLTSKYENRVKSDLPFKYKFETVEGLSPEEKLQLYGPEGSRALELAEQQIQANPEILDIFDGDKDKTIEYLRNRNMSTAGQYRHSVDSKYVDDDWGLYMAKRAAEQAPPEISGLKPTTDVPTSNTVTTGRILDALTGAPEGTTQNLPNVSYDNKGNIVVGESAPSLQERVYGRSTINTMTGQPYSGGREGYGIPYNKQAHELQLRIKQVKTSNPTLRDKSDREVIDALTQAASNSVEYYGQRGLTFGQGVTLNMASPFVDDAGNFVYSGAAELEVLDPQTGKYKGISESDMAKDFGYTNDDGTARTNLQDQFKNLSQKDMTFNDAKGAKLFSTVYGANGQPYTIKYKAKNEKIPQIFKERWKLQQSVITPGTKTINANGMKVVVETKLQQTPLGWANVPQVKSIEPLRKDDPYFESNKQELLGYGDMIIPKLFDVVEQDAYEAGKYYGDIIIDRKPSQKTELE